MSTDRRTVTVNGQTVRYTYDLRTRRVLVPSKGLDFVAVSYDSAPHDIKQRLAPAAVSAPAAAPQAPAPAPAPAPNVFRTATLTHDLVILPGGVQAPKCRRRPTKGHADYSARYGISCNACSGAHLTGTRLG